ncbi:MAG TPA: hypothetical protein PLY87_29555 [Planctomycetaceae bacterium]|nr:hypothetical protein [Planctomycetaceae bacterium]
MPILKSVDRSGKCPEPTVWISRIVLFKSLDPPVLIREPISLKTGLNIIWGIEDDSDDDRFEPGHGVGKTTLCRLLRYCLGESSYGQAHAAKEISHTFPDGFVAAEVHVQGQQWAVLRPFDKHRSECACLNATIERLVENRPSRTSFSEYISHLSSVCLGNLRSNAVLMAGASIEWPHLLAMCARDQEARYQSLWQWRSPRSDSGPPKIQREDAFLILRSVLGILPNGETLCQRRLADIDGQLSKSESESAERRREPEYWINYYRSELQRDFRIADATFASLESGDLFSLPALVDRRVIEHEAAQTNRRERLQSIDRQINMTTTAILEPQELLEQEKVAADVTDSATNVLMGAINELRQLRHMIKNAEYSYCTFGETAIGECSYAQRQLTELDQQIKDATRSAVPEAAERDQIVATLNERRSRIATVIQGLQARLDDLESERRSLDDERRNADLEVSSVRRSLNQLLDWEMLRSGRKVDSELARLQERKTALETDQTFTRLQLSELLKAQDTSLKKLREVYATLIRNTLSSDFKGRVSLTRDGLEFRIFRGENLSGEAFETLSILLADIAMLVMGAIASAAHPGLLIHDSPREADLGSHI